MALLEDKIAVVSGGAAGIGGGITRSLAGAGAHVVVNDIDADLLAGTVQAVTEGGGTIAALHGDIRDPAVVAALADLARSVAEDAGRADGGVDVLVNNVGDYRPNGRFLKTTEADWQALYAVNLEHVLRLTHAVAPAMAAQGSGSIVNVSTVEAFRGIPANAVYSAFNAGVNAFTRSLAVELGRDGVRVNAIAPDLADTLQTPAEAMLRGRDPEMTRHWLPLGRFGQPGRLRRRRPLPRLGPLPLRHRPRHPRRRRHDRRQRLVPPHRPTRLDQPPRPALTSPPPAPTRGPSATNVGRRREPIRGGG